jgi:hypothetical protein
MPDGTTAIMPEPPALEYRSSPDLGEFFAALAKAQGKMRNAAKDAANPHFKSKYADLASISDACRAALSESAIAVLQIPFNEGQDIGIVTRLGHASGQWMEGRLKVAPAKWDAQSIGSVCTYLRRYSLAAMAGVAPGDDDDGEAAVGRGNGAPSTMAAPANNGARRAAPRPAADEPDTKTQARDKFTAILARVKAARRDDQIDQTLDDARDDIAFIKTHAGEEHAQSLYDKAAERKAQLAGLAEATPAGAHP